jgi:FkbM family methyltransferase
MDKKYNTKISISKSFDKNSVAVNSIRNKIVNYIKADNCITPYIRVGYPWEEWMLKYIEKYYVKNTNMIDLGAHIGTSSLFMSEVISENCKIYAFDPVYHDILFKNVIDNNLLNKIVVYPYGLGNTETVLQIREVDFRTNFNFGSFSFVSQNNPSKSENLVNIDIVPLDWFHFENVSLIKIDVEHMEIEVLEGSYELIKRCRPTIIIETWNLNVFKESSIFKKLQELGYTIESIPEGNIDCDFIMKII